MLKFVKHHMETISGIEIYPIISFLIFFLFFLAIATWVVKADKNHFRKMSNLPLDPSNENDELQNE